MANSDVSSCVDLFLVPRFLFRQCGALSGGLFTFSFYEGIFELVQSLYMSGDHVSRRAWVQTALSSVRGTEDECRTRTPSRHMRRWGYTATVQGSYKLVELERKGGRRADSGRGSRCIPVPAAAEYFAPFDHSVGRLWEHESSGHGAKANLGEWVVVGMLRGFDRWLVGLGARSACVCRQFDEPSVLLLSRRTPLESELAVELASIVGLLLVGPRIGRYCVSIASIATSVMLVRSPYYHWFREGSF